MKKVFIGIMTENTEKIIPHLEKIKRIFQWEKIKWIDVSDYHTTIYYLSLIDDKKLSQIKDKLNTALKDKKQFDIEYNGCGLLKNIHTPRSLWLGIKENSYLNELNKIVTEIVANAGISPDSFNYTPRITIGTMKWIDQQSSIPRFIKEYSEIDFGKDTVTQIGFYEIYKSKGNKKYRILDAIDLKQ